MSVCCDRCLMFFLQSFGTAGTALSSLLAWPIADTLGRKISLLISGFPAFIGWLLIVYSAYIEDNWGGFVTMLLLGRLLTGAAAGISASTVTVSKFSHQCYVLIHCYAFTF